MTTQAPTPITPQQPTSQSYEAAFAATSAARAELAPAELIAIFAEVPAAAIRAWSVAKNAEKYDAALGTMPIPAGVRQRVQLYAEGAIGAHENLMLQIQRPPVVVPMIEELRAERDVLLADIRALIARNKIPSDHLDGVAGTVGHRAIAQDVSLLAGAILRTWDAVQGRTGATREELEQLRVRAKAAAEAVGMRELQEKERNEATDARQRAFTLLVKEYDELRTALTFLLRASPEELASAAPSLQTGRPRRIKEDDDAESPVPATTGIASAPPAAGTPAGGTTTPAAPIPVGMPGSSPFINR